MNGDSDRFPSGAWTGYYQQHGSRWRQDLDLAFANGTLRGTGSDPVGAFAVRGTFDAVTGEVTWRKTYAHGGAVVHYRGFREGKGIWGVWEIRAYERSGFHIWPRAAGALEGEAAATEAALPASAPPAPAMPARATPSRATPSRTTPAPAMPAPGRR